MTRLLHPDIEELWDSFFPKLGWIPAHWPDTISQLKKLLSPTIIDLIRVRTIDLDALLVGLVHQSLNRREFIKKLSSTTSDDDKRTYLKRDDVGAGRDWLVEQAM